MRIKLFITVKSLNLSYKLQNEKYLIKYKKPFLFLTFSSPNSSALPNGMQKLTRTTKMSIQSEKKFLIYVQSNLNTFVC